MAIVTGKSHKVKLLLSHLFMCAFIALTVFPLILVISVSFRPGNFAAGEIFPHNPSLEHWALALGFDYKMPDGTVRTPPFPVLLWLWNSVKIAAISSFLVLLLSTTCAYAFARMRFAFKAAVMDGMLIMQMFPAVLALVAIYTIFDSLGNVLPWLGIGTHGAVILSYLGGIALHVWTIKGYFETIDASMEESAIIDGATHFQAFRYVLLPMSAPILVVVFILAFIGTIIEYPVASILLQKEETLTLAVGSRQYLYEQHKLWGDFAAAAVLSGLPITLVFIWCQRWIVSGLTAGGVKG
jgi:maltose/maltodextrin transport system permease protein